VLLPGGKEPRARPRGPGPRHCPGARPYGEWLAHARLPRGIEVTRDGKTP